MTKRKAAGLIRRHCKKRSDEAIAMTEKRTLDCFVALAMTEEERWIASLSLAMTRERGTLGCFAVIARRGATKQSSRHGRRCWKE
jgi:hypothetical protein